MYLFRSPLIQRISPPNEKLNPFSFGGGRRHGGLNPELASQIYTFATFDYMGAAQYEFGALAESWEQLVSLQKSNYLSFKKIVIKGKDIWLISAIDMHLDAKKYIRKLCSAPRAESRLPAYSNFPYVMNGEPAYNNQGWIDIKNNYMFFVNQEMAQNFHSLILKEAQSAKTSAE